MRYIFIDFEMNPIENSYKKEREICKGEIIEIGAVMLSEDYQETDSFKRYVKPVYSSQITKKYRELTGITTRMLEDKEGLGRVLEEFINWCEAADDTYEIYAWSENDLLQLEKEMALKKMKVDEKIGYAMAHWHDFQEEFCRILGLEKRISLELAIGSIEREFEGEMHDALWDARNTAYIYAFSRDEKAFQKKMKPIMDLFNPPEEPGDQLGDLFDFSRLLTKKAASD